MNKGKDMEICPNCNQLMTWYLTYNCGNPVSGYHCYHCGYDTKNNSHEITTNKTIRIDNQPKPIIQRNIVEVSDDSINKIADAVVRKLEIMQTNSQMDCQVCNLRWYNNESKHYVCMVEKCLYRIPKEGE